MARNNVATVRRLWEAFASDGPQRVLELAPDDVEWQPFVADGRTLLGSSDLRDFWAGLGQRGERVEAELREIEEIGEHAVIAAGTLRHTHGHGVTAQELAWLFCFRDGRLWRASAHATVEEARHAVRFCGAPGPAPAARSTLLEIERGPGVLRVRGELDLSTVDRLTRAVGRGPAAGETLRIDLSELSFIDSSGLREMLRLAREAERAGWTLEIVPAPEHVQRVFALARIEEALPFVR